MVWEFQAATDGADGALLDFTMAGNRGDFARGRVLPDCVIAAFASQGATVRAQMALQVKPFHDGAS